MDAGQFKAFIDRQIAGSPAEAKIVRKIVRTLKAAGKPIVEVFDGGEYVPVRTERDVMEQAFNLDECFLYTDSGSWVRITMGNEWDAVSDYTLGIERDLAPVFAWIEKKEEQANG